MNKYDVIVIGAGISGITSACKVKENNRKVLLIEKGRDIDGRQCVARDRDRRCITCSPCNLVCGLGGAGAFSDGKLTLSDSVGGRLADYVGEERMTDLIQYVDDTYRRFGAPEKLYGVGDDVDRLCHQAALAGLRLKPVPIRHLGTDIAVSCGHLSQSGENVQLSQGTRASQYSRSRRRHLGAHLPVNTHFDLRLPLFRVEDQ